MQPKHNGNETMQNNLLTDESKDSLVAAINEFTTDQVEYEESHEDAGDGYAHLPRESWTSADSENLRQFLSDNGIDDCGLDMDAIAELALDNFTMRASHTLDYRHEDAFCCGSYPVQEIEIQIGYAALTEACGFEVTRAHIEQLGNAPDSYIGSISDDSCLAYSTSDVVWLADIGADELARLIIEESERWGGIKTMRVWLVWFHNFQGEFEFNGVFSSEEKARSYVNKFNSEKHLFIIELQDLE